MIVPFQIPWDPADLADMKRRLGQLDRGEIS
jgi:hypothetical protein